MKSAVTRYPFPTSCDFQAARSGFSLLEVLVACGILVVGLTSVASILPAASARLREAATQDRAAAMAAAALSEFECRELAFRGLFTTAANTYVGANKAVCFGEVLRNVPSTATVVAVSGTAPTLLSERIDNSPASNGERRGFFLEDEIQFQSGAGSWPLNSFVGGTREFRRGVCWGAMVEPSPWNADPNPAAANPMRSVRATIAIFRKPTDTAPLQITLSGSAGSMFTVTTPVIDEPTRKKYLNGCTRVLAVGHSSPVAPEWLTVNSSWIQGSVCRIVFRDDPESERYKTLASTGTLQILAFENILAITQQTYAIE